MAYSFGGTTGETADSLKRKRAYVQAMLESAIGQQPQTIGDGIAVLGRALAGRMGQAVLDKRQREGTAAAMKAAGGNAYIRDLLLGNSGGGAAAGASPAPGNVGAGMSGKDYFSAIKSAESGGNPNAKNPRSSATGLYQFTDGTWDAVAKAHPQLGLTPDGRRDPDQQERAIRAFTADNAKILAGSGIEPTGGNLYAAHFLGAGGARSVLSQPDNASVAAIVGPGVVKANPFLARMTVGDFKRWAASKGGNNVLEGGEAEDQLRDAWGKPDPNRPGHGINTQTGAPASFSQPDPARYGPTVAPKADRLPQPGAFNPMVASAPFGPQSLPPDRPMPSGPIPQMAQGMPQQAPTPQPRPQMAPEVDPMQTAAVPQMRPRGIVSPRAEDNGYVRGPGAVMQQPGGQGGGLLARMLMRQPMPQPAQGQPMSGTGGTATAPGGGGNDELMQMYELIDSPYLPESYRAALLDALKQKQQQGDPAYQADLAYKQAQTRALENPEPQFIPGKDGSIFRADKKSGNVEQVYGGKPDQPTDVREYEYAKQQGYQGTFNDWQLAQKRAGASSVNIDQKSESAFDTELAKKQAGTFDTMAAEGLNARADLGIINELGTLLQGQGGTFTGVSGALAKYGIGGEGIDDIQAAQALINKLVPTQRSPGSGSMSDRDVELFTRSLPSLWNTPGGNEKILNVMRGLAQYKQAQGEIADMVIMGEMTRQEARQALRNLPNPLAEFAPKGGDGVEVDGYKVREVP